MFFVVGSLLDTENVAGAPSFSEPYMTNYDVLREFGDGISQADLDQAVERSNEATESMREDGHTISYIGSDVFVDESGSVLATMCRYDAESEADVREQSARGDLPVSKVLLRSTPVHGKAPRTGVGNKAA